ncbi:MAG: hypothetical protein NTY80_04225 [candidate division SR1 bacterium]|nr:hypothetical protein [candidate division SR1 bacterium]
MKNFISNEDLVREFFKETLQEKYILNHLLVIVSLVKKYGHKLNIADHYLQIIGKNNPEIVKLYKVLHILGKTNIKDLNDIVKICKKIYVQYKKEFMITSDTSTQGTLKKYINKIFPDADINSNETSVLEIDIKGEGYRYHRNLKNDLDTILGQ